MRFYFLSAKPCALKLGGAYAGMIGGADVFIDLSPEESILCEMIPVDPAFLPISFLIDDGFLAAPPIPAIVGPTAIILKAENFLHADSTMKLVAQECYPDCTASVFLQGTMQASVESGGEIFTFPLTDDYRSSRILRKNDCILIIGKNHLCAVSVRGERLLYTPVVDFSCEEELKITVPHFDCMNHFTQSRYRLTDKAELLESKLLFRYAPKEELYLYALLEGLLLHADCSAFVTESLAKRLSELKRFLGNYESVLFITQEVAGLVYRMQGNLYRLTYFTAEWAEGRIDNILEKSMEE